MVKKIIFIILLLIGFVLLLAAFQPSEYVIERSIRITASQQTIFANVNDLKKFNEWNPWAKLDPQAKMTFDGPTEGLGASYKWEGNNEVGAGRMSIQKSVPNNLVQMKLEMFKPFEDVSFVEFILKPEGRETLITWSMKGNANYIYKLLCLFINRDKLVGKEFEKGLTNLKLMSEKN